MNKLSAGQSIYYTRPLTDIILSYAKTKDRDRRHPTAILFKHLHFVRPSKHFTQELVIFQGTNFNKIIYPNKYSIYNWPW
tara:strand:- start:2688 stop:2927 length:240 start_codon:yes stop_codon:yes gene_type:complete